MATKKKAKAPEVKKSKGSSKGVIKAAAVKKLSAVKKEEKPKEVDDEPSENEDESEDPQAA